MSGNTWRVKAERDNGQFVREYNYKRYKNAEYRAIRCLMLDGYERATIGLVNSVYSPGDMDMVALTIDKEAGDIVRTSYHIAIKEGANK